MDVPSVGDQIRGSPKKAKPFRKEKKQNLKTKRRLYILIYKNRAMRIVKLHNNFTPILRDSKTFFGQNQEEHEEIYE